MEQVIRDAYRQAITNTPLQVSNDLLCKPLHTWTFEDLEWSESSQRALVRSGLPLMFYHRLAKRHKLESTRLLASESSPYVRAVVDTAQRILQEARS